MKQLIFCAVILMFFVSCDSLTHDSLAGISGYILDEDTLDGIKGARVTLRPTGKDFSTTSEGFFEFRDLDVQQYSVSVYKNGYKPDYKQIMTFAGEIEIITIKLSKPQGKNEETE